LRIGLARALLYVVCLSAVIILSQFVYELRGSAQDQFRTDFRAATSEFTFEVKHSVSTAITYVLSTGAFFESSAEVLEEEFARFVIRSRFLSDSPHLRSINVIPYFESRNLQAFRNALKSREKERSFYGYPPVEIPERDDQSHYAPIIYSMGPDSRNGILGFDLVPRPEIMTYAQAALLSTQPHITPPFNFTPDGNEVSHDVLILSAVKNSGDLGLRNDTSGDKTIFIAASYSPAIAISNIITDAAFRIGFDLCIFDITDSTPIPIYGTTNAAKGQTPLIEDRLVLGNRVWALQYFSLPGNMGNTNIERSMVLGAVGIALILALTIAIDRLIRGRSLLEHEVDERTRQLHSLNKALSTAARQASAESDAKSMFLAHMSHELRTPLNAIIGYSQILKREPFGKLGDERYIEYAGTIEEAGQIQLQFVEDILSLTALQGGKRDFDFQRLDLTGLAEKCVAILQTRITDKSLDVKITSTVGTHPFYGDERSLQQIFLNLLSNSIKFTPDGGHITVRLEHHDEETTTIAVEDTGIGIAPEYIDKVLQPFGQAHLNAYNSREGVGLGLSIVTGITQALGGAVRIESEPDKGTIIIVELPNSPASDATDI
jgi:signal transduction histidine kinase